MAKSFMSGLRVLRALKCISKQFDISRKEETKSSSIAKILNIKQPSVVSMLHKLNEENFVEYS